MAQPPEYSTVLSHRAMGQLLIPFMGSRSLSHDYRVLSPSVVFEIDLNAGIATASIVECFA